MKITHLKTQHVEFMPEIVEEGVIYVSLKYGTAIHLCACGCKGQVVTPFRGLLAWDMTEDHDGVTLKQSIGNQSWPCRSHYHVTNGAVIPC